jgi:hypothetical protein
MFNLFGALPDILMGRKPLDALLGNAATVAAMFAAPQILGTSGLLGAADAGTTAASGLEGMGFSAPAVTGVEQAAAPVIDYSTQAGLGDTLNYNTGGLLGKAADYGNTASQYAKPAMTAMNAASMAKNMFGSTPQPQMTQPPQMRNIPMNLNGLLQQSGDLQKYDMEEQARKRAQMQAYINSIGGR